MSFFQQVWTIQDSNLSELLWMVQGSKNKECQRYKQNDVEDYKGHFPPFGGFNTTIHHCTAGAMTGVAPPSTSTWATWDDTVLGEDGREVLEPKSNRAEKDGGTEDGGNLLGNSSCKIHMRFDSCWFVLIPVSGGFPVDLLILTDLRLPLVGTPSRRPHSPGRPGGGPCGATGEKVELRCKVVPSLPTLVMQIGIVVDKAIDN